MGVLLRRILPLRRILSLRRILLPLGRVLLGRILATVAIAARCILFLVFALILVLVAKTQAAEVIGDAIGVLFEESHARGIAAT